MSKTNLQRFTHLSESEKIVLHALLEEAEYKVREKIKKGKSQGESIKEVSSDMKLENDETEELENIFNNPSKPVATEDNPYPNSIYFNDPSDINSAVGVLMYNNIPWDSKGVDTDTPYIQFNDQESLSKAMNSLGRKWDFVNNKQDNVASISFDNVSDYKKVLDFILKSGMFVNFSDSQGLDEDVNQVEKEKVIDHSGRSFRAETKKLKEKVDPIRNKEQRSVKIRKRFK